MTLETFLAIIGAFVIGALSGWFWRQELQHERLRKELYDGHRQAGTRGSAAADADAEALPDANPSPASEAVTRA